MPPSLNRKKARSTKRARLVFFGMLLMAGTLPAACPPGSNPQLRTRNSINTQVNLQGSSWDEGATTLVMPLSLPLGDAQINPTTVPTSTTLQLNRWLWRFRIRLTLLTTPPPYWPPDANDLVVTYDVNGSGSNSGWFHSVLDPSSRIRVTVVTREIRQRNRFNRRIFRGFVDLKIDYGQATRSGDYVGTITTTVDCP